MTLLLCLAVLELTGCASSVPSVIRQPPPDNPALSKVRAQPQAYTGTPIRWGGTIAAVHNFASESHIEVVERALYSGGRPQEDSPSAGRFIVRMQGFVDPAIYGQGRSITVYGRITGSTTRKIGEFPYRYPVVDSRATYLWEPLPERPDYIYDPWYGPIYPHYPWHRPYYPYYW